MIGIAIATSLIASLLLVHFSLRRQPMPHDRPLDVDTGLPLPELGQASTVFSLSALFGAYFGIHLLLGFPAVLGLATGTVLALFLLRIRVEQVAAKSFDHFLTIAFDGKSSNLIPLAMAISATQCLYATSELLIFQGIADTSLGMRSDHASLLAISIGVVAYFYVLFGGYMAVFRTDVLQFLFVLGMGLVVLIFTDFQLFTGHNSVLVFPRPGYWPLPMNGPSALLYTYHFTIGTLLGISFIIASPDAWKRVYLVSTGENKSSLRFAFFVTAGGGPFALLFAVDQVTSSIPDGPMNLAGVWTGMLTSSILFGATFVALIASFLSAFNGALLTSVHIGLVIRRHLKPLADERSRFHWLMSSTLLAIFFLYTAMRALENPYLLGNVIFGLYAPVAAILLGTRGLADALPRGSVHWILTTSVTGWMVYFISEMGVPKVPTTFQINTIAGGILIFTLAFLVTRLLVYLEVHGVRR